MIDVSYAVIPGRPKGPGPESIATGLSVRELSLSCSDTGYGFRAPRFARPRNDELGLQAAK